MRRARPGLVTSTYESRRAEPCAHQSHTSLISASHASVEGVSEVRGRVYIYGMQSPHRKQLREVSAPAPPPHRRFLTPSADSRPHKSLPNATCRLYLPNRRASRLTRFNIHSKSRIRAPTPHNLALLPVELTIFQTEPDKCAPSGIKQLLTTRFCFMVLNKLRCQFAPY